MPGSSNESLACTTYVGGDVPLLDYIERLDQIGEDVSLYSTLWYYY